MRWLGEAFSILILLLVTIQPACAEKNTQGMTTFSFGNYIEHHGDDYVNGVTLSISHKQFLTEAWAYFIQIGNGTASGEHANPDGSTVTINSNRTSLSSGLNWHYMTKNKLVTPYIGFGLSIHRYHYDFEYTDSEIGQASGTGYGPLLTAGARISIASHLLVIPGYRFEQIYIAAETGEQKTVTFSGLMLALLFHF
jgi:hypothetical protein